MRWRDVLRGQFQIQATPGNRAGYVYEKYIGQHFFMQHEWSFVYHSSLLICVDRTESAPGCVAGFLGVHNREIWPRFRLACQHHGSVPAIRRLERFFRKNAANRSIQGAIGKALGRNSGHRHSDDLSIQHQRDHLPRPLRVDNSRRQRLAV